MQKKREADTSFDCLDCSANTSDLGEYYMVTDEVWRTATFTLTTKPKTKGMLCVACLEHRLERKLDHQDFSWCPLNIIGLFSGSEKLKDRLGAYGMLGAIAEQDLRRIAWGIVDSEITRDTAIEKLIEERRAAAENNTPVVT